MGANRKDEQVKVLVFAVALAGALTTSFVSARQPQISTILISRQLAELAARVRALTRRGMSGAPTIIRHGSLSFDQVGRSAELCGSRLDLSARELSLLELFLQRPGQLVDKERLVEHLCAWGEEVSTNAIEVYVHRLRRKLEPGGVTIATVRGAGYRLEAPADT